MAIEQLQSQNHQPSTLIQRVTGESASAMIILPIFYISLCPVSGEFSAPTAGLYIFFGHVLTKAGVKGIETALTVNDETKLWFYAGGTSSFHGSGSNLLVVHLQKGDKVKMIKLGPFGTRPFYIHHVWSTFSGFLLRADTSQ